jgi:DNA-binding transcriptional MerR regulator
MIEGSGHLDKAPDAFRTISEVAEDLDIPQHVLRFWETRFTQIKPMKRSGGRRYYRPDDVDLLRGIRRLLYGEGYTIRGVQRILKEHGIKSVQALVDGSSAAPSFGAANEAALREALEEGDDAPEIDAVEDEEEDEIAEPPPAVVARRAPEFSAPSSRVDGAVRPAIAAPGVESGGGRRIDTARLESALQDLIACRQLLDSALKDG